MNAFNKAGLLAMVTIVTIGSTAPALARDNFSEHTDADGTISLPADFRIDMVHLGSWYVPEGGASGFHDVYTERRSVEAFRETGEFPDGATLVKELRASHAGDYSTGKNVSYATSEDIKQWFVMIKDKKNRFADNPLWGNGWGWALFKPDNPSQNVAKDYKIDCLGCHIPAQETDLVYIEAYPSLRNK